MNLDEAEKAEDLDSAFSANGQFDVEDSSLTIGAAYGAANEKLVTFIEKNVMLLKENLLKSSFPDLQAINRAYINYMPLLLSLTSLYQRVKFDADKAQKELDLFDDQAMDSVKKELNRDDNRKTWYSSSELKAAAHTKYKAKYAALQAKVALAEGRRSFIERLCKAWDTWQFGLGQLSRNLIAEANANGLDIKAQGLMPADPDDNKMDMLVDQALAQSR